MNTERSRQDHPLAHDGDNNWTTLAERLVDDVAEIGKAEMRIFENALGLLFTELTDRLVASLLGITALSTGGVFLFGALIVLLHIWIAWWLSLALSGLLAVIVGAILGWVATHRKSASQAGYQQRPSPQNDPA